MEIETSPPRPVSHWRIILAFLLDFFSEFLVLGMLIAGATGSTKDRGFELHGWPALIFLASLLCYFVVFDRFFGGTVWKRILGVVPGSMR